MAKNSNKSDGSAQTQENQGSDTAGTTSEGVASETVEQSGTQNATETAPVKPEPAAKAAKAETTTRASAAATPPPPAAVTRDDLIVIDVLDDEHSAMAGVTYAKGEVAAGRNHEKAFELLRKIGGDVANYPIGDVPCRLAAKDAIHKLMASSGQFRAVAESRREDLRLIGIFI